MQTCASTATFGNGRVIPLCLYNDVHNGVVTAATIVAHFNEYYQEYISSKSVQLLQTAFLHIDVTSTSANPIILVVVLHVPM